MCGMVCLSDALLVCWYDVLLMYWCGVLFVYWYDEFAVCRCGLLLVWFLFGVLV